MQPVRLFAFALRSSRLLQVVVLLLTVGLGVSVRAFLRPMPPAAPLLSLRTASTVLASTGTPPRSSAPGLSARQANTASAIAELKRRGLYTSLQQTMQAALYRVEPERGHAGHFTADNPAQRYSMQFGVEGVKVQTGSGPQARQDLSLHLSGIDVSGQRLDAAPVHLQAKGDRIEYNRGNVQEWYANTPQGLEQGFTIVHAPVSGNGKQGKLRVHLAVMGDRQGHLSQDRQWIDLQSASNHSRLRYGKLEAQDARGRVLGSHLRLSGQEIALDVDTQQAVYPVRIDPLIVGSGSALTASDGAVEDLFGSSVSLDGNTALIGAQGRAIFTNVPGAAYIFVRHGYVWSQQAKLTASDAVSGDEFGSSVCLSGNTALIGAPNPASGAGAAYLFIKTGGIWTQQTELTAGDETAGDYFGSSVSLSGNTALVGSPSHAHNTGSAYVFTKNGGTWNQQTELTASDGAQNDYFGSAVSLSGNTALAGAPYHASNGAAYVFTGSGGAWSQQAELTASDGVANDAFGSAVSVSGNTALVGATSHTSNGAAYAFTNSSGAWSQQAELTSHDGASGSDFGSSVSISGNLALVGADELNSQTGGAYVFPLGPELNADDGAQGDQFGYAVSLSGNTALVGAPDHASNTGAAYLFTNNSGTWSLLLELTANDKASGDQFGSSVSIRGNTALIGAPGHNSVGAAYLFVRSGGTWIQQQELTSNDGVSGDLFGSAVSISDSNVLIGAPGKASSTGAAYLFVPSGNTWTQQAEWTANDKASGDQFGSAVSVSANTALVGAPGKATNTGAAYLFTNGGGTWTQQKLTSSDGAQGDKFGVSVSVNTSTALVGAPGHATNTGAAYIFVSSGSIWTQQAELTASDATQDDSFGQSVSLNGNMALIGASGRFYNTGVVFLFTGSDEGWTQLQELTAGDGNVFDFYGQAVSLSGDTVLVGAPFKFILVGAAYTLGQSPLAQKDTYTAYVNTPLSVANAEGILANDTDSFAFPLAALLAVPPANGSLTLNLDGSFLYTPDNNFSGTDTFAYQATDGFDISDLTWVTIQVITPIPPVISDLDPTEGAAGATSLYLLINGMDFTTGSVVSVNNTPVATLFISDMLVEAVVPASFLSTPTTLSVQVNNPQPNGASNSVDLPVVNFLSSVSTGTFIIGGSPTTLTIRLNTPAPLGGLTLALSSSQPGVAQFVDTSNNPISQITFTTGQQTVQIKVKTTAVSAQTPVQLQASVGGTNKSATLLVLPPQQTGVGVIKKPGVGPPLHSPGLPK